MHLPSLNLCFVFFQAKHQVDRVKHKTPGLDSNSGHEPRSPPTKSPPLRPVSDAPSSHFSGSPSGASQARREYKRTQSDVIVDKTPTGRPRSEVNLEGLRRNSQPHSPQSCPNFAQQDNSNNANTGRSSAHQRVCSPGRVSNDGDRKLKGSPVHRRVCSPGRSSPTRSTGSVRSSYDNVNTSSRSHSAVSRNSSMDILSSLGFDTSNNTSKSKGSPVTALKEAIDRGYLNDGHVIARDIAKSHGIDIQDPDGYLQPKQSKESDKVID